MEIEFLTAVKLGIGFSLGSGLLKFVTWGCGLVVAAFAATR